MDRGKKKLAKGGAHFPVDSTSCHKGSLTNEWMENILPGRENICSKSVRRHRLLRIISGTKYTPEHTTDLNLVQLFICNFWKTLYCLFHTSCRTKPWVIQQFTQCRDIMNNSANKDRKSAKLAWIFDRFMLMDYFF